MRLQIHPTRFPVNSRSPLWVEIFPDISSPFTEPVNCCAPGIDRVTEKLKTKPSMDTS